MVHVKLFIQAACTTSDTFI